MKTRSITSDTMYKIEEKGHSVLGMRRFLMMENAGHGIADYIIGQFKKLKNKQITVVCGMGNNGGDGFVAARHLAGYGAKIAVILLGDPADLKSEEAKMNWAIIDKMASVEKITGKQITEDAKKRIKKADIILDGIFGTGIRSDIKEPHATAIGLMNKSNAFVLAIDVPSGLDPNTGKIHDLCVKADATITFHRLKVGLAAKRARKYTGPIHVEWIGIPPEAEDLS